MSLVGVAEFEGEPYEIDLRTHGQGLGCILQA